MKTGKFTEALKSHRRVLVLLCFLLITTANFYYVDTNSIIRQGICVWEALFSGHFLHYYSVAAQAHSDGLMAHNANYDIIQSTLMGLWQLPLYLLEKLLGGNILDHFLARLYGKLYLIVTAVLTGRTMMRIGRDLGMQEDRREELLYFFLSGPILLSSVTVVGQADILGAYFIVKTLQAVIRRQDGGALFYGVLAVQCKFFAVFLLLPVLLLTQKRLWRIITGAATPLLVSLLLSLPFRLADPMGTADKADRLAGMVGDMTALRLSFWAMDIPILFLAVAAVGIWAWLQDDVEAQRGQRVLWAALAGGVSLLVTIDRCVYVYWFVYLSPVLALLYMLNDRRRERVYLLELASSAGWLVGELMYFRGALGAIEDGLAWQIWGEREHYLTWGELWQHYGHESYYRAWMVTWAVFTVGMAALMAWYYPRKGAAVDAATDDDGVRAVRPWMLSVRAALHLLLCNSAVLFYIMGK